MNRVEIKNKAKELIRGNKWFIWKPTIIFALVVILITIVTFSLDYALGLTKTEVIKIGEFAYNYTSGGIFTYIGDIVVGILSCAFGVGYAMYLLSFIRGTKLTSNDIVDFMKKHWVITVLVSLTTGLIVAVGMILLIIPGIIAAFGFTFYREVCADNTELKTKEIVKKAWELTKGHKMDIFILGLSFIGWCILAGFTFGLLYIWLVPYITVTFTLTYEELRKNAQ